MSSFPIHVDPLDLGDDGLALVIVEAGTATDAGFFSSESLG